MKRAIKLVGVAALLGAGIVLSGCVYDPAYYHRTGVVYSDGNAAVDHDDSYYDDRYYYSSGYYDPAYYGPYWGPYYGWGWPYVSLGFYGTWYGHHGYHGHGPYHPHTGVGRSYGGGRSAPPSSHHH